MITLERFQFLAVSGSRKHNLPFFKYDKISSSMVEDQKSVAWDVSPHLWHLSDSPETEDKEEDAEPSGPECLGNDDEDWGPSDWEPVCPNHRKDSSVDELEKPQQVHTSQKKNRILSTNRKKQTFSNKN